MDSFHHGVYFVGVWIEPNLGSHPHNLEMEWMIFFSGLCKYFSEKKNLNLIQNPKCQLCCSLQRC